MNEEFEERRFIEQKQEALEKLIADEKKALENTGGIEEEEKQPAEEESRVPIEYSCTKCRKVLFNDSIFEEHTSELKRMRCNPRKRGNNQKECSSYFLAR